jgi:DNA-binding transcriptional regulator YhcF (GntR family)
LNSLPDKQLIDEDVRHFIYQTFAETAHPPTTRETAEHFGVEITAVSTTYHNLANAHHIALASGTDTIWMAHPFSAIPTNWVTETGGKKYWGN